MGLRKFGRPGGGSRGVLGRVVVRRWVASNRAGCSRERAPGAATRLSHVRGGMAVSILNLPAERKFWLSDGITPAAERQRLAQRTLPLATQSLVVAVDL